MNLRLTSTIALFGALLAACASGSDDAVVIPGGDGGAITSESIEVVDTSPADTSGVATTLDSTPDSTASATSTTTTVTTTAPPAPSPAPAPVSTASEVEYLRQGDEGPRIATMQRELITLELLPAGSDTGVFDSATNSALLSFQGQWGLIVDGVFGPETDRALTAAAQSVAG